MDQYDVFISYRRDGGWPVGQLLYNRLSMDGYRVFYDIESMRSGKFNEQIYRSIDNSSTMVVILPPGALDRCADEDDWVRREISYAIKQQKTLIPVIMQGFKTPESLPDDMKSLLEFQGVNAENNISFDFWYAELLGYINEHLDHVPGPVSPRQKDQAVHKAELTDALIHACQENQENTIIALIGSIRKEGFLSEEIMDMAISHFIKNEDWENSLDLIQSMVDDFPESEKAHNMAVNHLILHFPKHHPELIRQYLDWLLENSQINIENASYDILCELLQGREEKALEKLERYKDRADISAGLDEAVSKVFYQTAQTYLNDYDGKEYFSTKLNYEQWKHFMKLAISESNDIDRKKGLEKELRSYDIPGFIWSNIPALLVLLAVAVFAVSPWNWICRVIFPVAIICSVIPAWMRKYYVITKEPVGFRKVVKIIGYIIGFPVWLVVSIFGLFPGNDENTNDHL